MKKALSLLLVLALIVALAAPALAADGGDWSYTVIAKAQYEDVRHFSDGLAAVKLGGKWGFINEQGVMVIQPQFSIASDFNGGKAVVSFDTVIDPQKEDYGDDMGAVYRFFGYGVHWSVIDKTGAIVCPLEESPLTDSGMTVIGTFPRLPELRDGFIYVAQQTVMGPVYYDVYDASDGSLVFPRPKENGRYQVAHGFGRDGLWPVYESEYVEEAVEKLGGLLACGWADAAGNWIQRYEWQEGTDSYISGTNPFDDGLSAVWLAEKNESGYYSHHMGFMNRSFEWVIGRDYRYLTWSDFAGAGYAIVSEYTESTWNKCGKYGAIDKNGNTVIPFAYDYIYAPADGMLRFLEGDWTTGRYGYVDEQSRQTAIPARYCFVSDFSGGLAMVSEEPVVNGSYGRMLDQLYLIDKSGAPVRGFEALDLSYYDLHCGGGNTDLRLADGIVFCENGLYGFVKPVFGQAAATPEPAPAPAAPGVNVSVKGAAVAWTDAEPFIDENNRTMVPLRAVAEALGLTVNWDGANREAIFTNGAKTLYFPIGSSVARTGDGSAVQMDTAAVIVNDRTYAPIRYLAEYFGFTVGWDGGTKTVLIS